MPRPTARDIVESVVQAMHDAHEPLDAGVVLVPAVYDVLIHPEAYRELEPILSRIKNQAKQRLEGEIERLNRPSRRFGGRLLRPLLRLFYPEHRLRRLVPGAQRIERAGEAWGVDILVTADPAARVEFLAVETDFGGRVSPVMRGDTGLQQRRRTTRLPEGGYETILITPAGSLRRGRPNGASTGRDRPSSGTEGASSGVDQTSSGAGADSSSGADESSSASNRSSSTPGRSSTSEGERWAPARRSGRTTREPRDSELHSGDGPGGAPPAARLDYEDRAGKHTYYFEKRRIVIGRDDESGTDLDVALDTPADVSREHVVIRQGAGAFEIKNVGRYGTRVNGRRLEPIGSWHPLPAKAEINLADSVIIRFESLAGAGRGADESESP